MPSGVAVVLATSRIVDGGGNRFLVVTLPWNVVVATTNVHISNQNDYANLAAGTSCTTSNVGVATLASAGTIPLPSRGEIFTVSGTTTIGNITGGWAGRTVTLVFNSALTVNHSTGTPQALRLSVAVPFVPSAFGGTLTLRHTGVQWFEIGRSA